MPDNINHRRRALTVIEGKPEVSSTAKGFADAAISRGWSFHHLSYIESDCFTNMDLDNIPLDYVIFRGMSRNDRQQISFLVNWLKKKRKIYINAAMVGGRISGQDKYFQQCLFMSDPLLRNHAIPSFKIESKDDVDTHIQKGTLQYPFVLKDRYGACGRDIHLIRRESDLDAIKNYHNLVAERYIRPECDYRVFVIGGVAVGFMRKTGDRNQPDNFRVWSAGREKYPEQDSSVTDILSEIATRSAAIAGIEYAGVDIIKEADTGNYYILENNIAGGWNNGFIEITGVNIPSLTIDWLEQRDKARHQTIAAAVQDYLNIYQKYLPQRIQDDCTAILKGKPYALSPYFNVFHDYPHSYLYDAGRIFVSLATAYQDFTERSVTAADAHRALIKQIESMPLSWAGNFIGPEVGTFHDGAILSAIYLYLLGKIKEV